MELENRPRGKLRGPTYFISGKMVNAQMIALMPPITSSFDGTEPVEGHIPFST